MSEQQAPADPLRDVLEPPERGFRAPRVPFDLRCVTLAALGYLLTLGIDKLLGSLFDVADPIPNLVGIISLHLSPVGTGFRDALQPVFGAASSAMNWWQALITAVAFFGVWAWVGAAILRTAALRLTRDEPISLKEALKFGRANWITFLLAPILVAAFAGFFVLANMLAGLLMSIPFLIGSIFTLVVYPLSLIASLLIVISILGGVIGLPLMWSGIAVEQNGALEALSRAYSYIFARPFRFIFGYFLIFALMGVVLFLSAHFERTVKLSLRAGSPVASWDKMVSQPPAPLHQLQGPYQSSPRVVREKEGITDIRNISDVSWDKWIGFVWMWLFTHIFLLGFKGFALYLFLGGTMSLYLQLRYEVDGTDEAEIDPHLDDDDALDGAAPPADGSGASGGADGSNPKWVGDGDKPAGDGAPKPAGDGPDGQTTDDSAETTD